MGEFRFLMWMERQLCWVLSRSTWQRGCHKLLQEGAGEFGMVLTEQVCLVFCHPINVLMLVLLTGKSELRETGSLLHQQPCRISSRYI